MISIMHQSFLDIFADGTTVQIAKGESLFRTEDPISLMFIVLEGRVDLVRHLKSGERMVLHSAGGGVILAEASAYSERYHCNGIAHCQSALRSVPVSTFLARLDADSKLANHWAAHLARILQRSRMSAEIRTLRRVSDRLEAWLELGNEVPAKGDIQGLAQRLGVSREALYRELGKRR